MALDDYLGLMGGAANIGGVPEAVQNALLGQQQIQGNALQLQQAQQAQQDQMAYRQAVSQALLHPSPQTFSQLTQQFPQYAKQTSEAMAAYGQPQKDAMFRTATTIYNYIGNGAWDQAQKVAEAEKAAEANAGMDTSHWDMILDAIIKRSPVAQGAAASVIEAYDPAKYAEVHKALYPGEKTGPDQKQYEYDLQLYGKEYADQAKFIRDSKVVSSPTGVYTMSPGTPSNPEGGDPSTGAAVDPPTILKGAAERGTITEQEAATVRSSLGANGDAKFRAWLAKNKIAVVPSVSGATKVVGGKTYRNVNGQWFEESE